MAILDLTGERFGRLKVVRLAGTTKRGRAVWLCRCRCRGTRVCGGGELRAGRIKACRRCARTKMGETLRTIARRRAERLKAIRGNDPAKILPFLTAEQRARYEQWDANCKRLHVYVPPAERLQVLKEIAA